MGVIGVRPYKVSVYLNGGNCASCGLRGEVAEIEFRHVGEGNPNVITLCKECYAKVLNEMMEEFGRVFPFDTLENNSLNELKKEVKRLESERDNWRKQALEEDARANNLTSNNASSFGSYKEMVDYWSSHYEEIKKPLMAWAFEKGGVK